MRRSWVSRLCFFLGGGVLCFRDTCHLMIRKIQFAPATNKSGPKAVITKQFIMSDQPIHLEASLEKEVGNKQKLSLKCLLNKCFSCSDLLPRAIDHC